MAQTNHLTKLPQSSRLLVMLLALNVFIIILHLLVHALELTGAPNISAELVTMFSMDSEASLPTWVAQTLLLTIAVLLGAIGYQKIMKQDRFRWHWVALSGIFTYLSIDEATAIHELSIRPLQELLSIHSGLLFFAWVIPAAILIAILIAVFYRFFFALPKTTQKTLALAAIIFVLGAIGVEMISGAYWQAHDFQYNMVYRLLNALEEGLENTGSIIAIYALFQYLQGKRSKSKQTK